VEIGFYWLLNLHVKRSMLTICEVDNMENSKLWNLWTMCCFSLQSSGLHYISFHAKPSQNEYFVNLQIL
jgi:hypothetical protein